MSKFKNLSEKSAKKKFLLTKLKDLNDSPKEKWNSFMVSEYELNQNSSSMDRKIISFVNSILFHGRIVFSFRKKDLRELFKSDNNWKKELGLKDSDYPKFIREIHDRGLVQTISHGKMKELSVYKVVDLDLLKFITGNLEEQAKEVINFTKYKYEPSSYTQEGNPELEKVTEILLEKIKNHIKEYPEYAFYDPNTETSLTNIKNYLVPNDFKSYRLPFVTSRYSKICTTNQGLLYEIEAFKGLVEHSFKLLVGYQDNLKIPWVDIKTLINDIYPNGFETFSDVDDFMEACKLNCDMSFLEISYEQFYKILNKKQKQKELIAKYFILKRNQKWRNYSIEKKRDIFFGDTI